MAPSSQPQKIPAAGPPGGNHQEQQQPSDPTFRFYTPNQASNYAAQRKGYAGPLIDHVLALHTSAGGHFGTVLDVGTGTGQVVRDVGPFFDTAFGVDPGVEMIAKADELSGSKEGQGVVFLVSAAEDIDKLDGIEQGSVDLITAGMAVRMVSFDAISFFSRWGGGVFSI